MLTTYYKGCALVIAAVLATAAMAGHVPSWGLVVAPKWLAIEVLAAVGCVLLITDRARLDVVDMVAGMMLAWAAASIAWTPDVAQYTHQMFHATALLILFILVRRVDQDFLITAMSWAAAAAIIVASVSDILRPDWRGGFGNDNLVSEMILVALPWAVWRVPWVIRSAVVIAAAYQLWDNPSHSEFVAFAGMVAFAICAWRRRVMTTDLLIIALGLSVVLLVVLWSSTELQTSLRFRWEFAQTTLRMWWAAPLIGQGFGGYLYQYPFFATAPFTEVVTPGTVVEAAHNEYLQLLSDLGLVGFGIVTIFAVMVLKRCVGIGPHCFSLAALATLALVSFPLQNPATAFMAVVGLGVMAPAFGRARRSALRRLVLPGLMAVTIAIVGYYGIKEAKAEQMHMIAENVKREVPKLAYQLERMALREYPFYNLRRIVLFPALMRWVRLGPKHGVPPKKFGEAMLVSTLASPRSNPVVLTTLEYAAMRGHLK